MDYIIIIVHVRRFDQISFRAHNSSLEGATGLKFAPFCSSFRALSDDMLFAVTKLKFVPLCYS